MSDNPYKAMLEELVQGQIAEIALEQSEFLTFREAWLAHPERKNIVGEAGLNGRVVYKFQKKI